jgi:hypothetical protein
VAPVEGDYTGAPAGFDIVGAHKLVLPQGARVFSTGLMRLEGGSVDGSGGGAQLLPVGDGQASPEPCSTSYLHWTSACLTPSVAATLQLEPDPVTGKTGRLVLVQGTSASPVVVTGTPSSTTNVLLDRDVLKAPVSVAGTAVVLSRSTFQAGVVLQHSSRNYVVNNVFDSRGTSAGLVLLDAFADVERTRITATESGTYPAGLFVDSDSGGTFRCLDLRHNSGVGIRNDAPVTLLSSNLTANDTKGHPGATDAQDNASLTTRGVWWGPGRALGPGPNQVSNRVNLHHSQDALLPVSCASPSGVAPAAS